MPDTTDAVTCAYCGTSLPRLFVGHPDADSWGFRACQCKGALAERERRARILAESLRPTDKSERLLQKSGIPKRYRGATHPDAEVIARGIEEGSGWFIHSRENGTGKTTLACAVAQRLIGKGISVRFEVVPSFLEAMRNRRTVDFARIDRLSTVDVLVLDDIGKEAPTAYSVERLFDVVNARYNALLPMVITSNIERGDLIDHMGEGTGRAVASRLVECTKPHLLNGADRRLAG